MSSRQKRVSARRDDKNPTVTKEASAMYDYRYTTGIVFSILAIAAGAIMYWAITAPTHGFRLSTVGVILMVAGALGLVISLVLYTHTRVNDRQRSTYEQHTVDAQGQQTVVREDITRS
jgi:TRAP-type C4-dicarboxylate transport system permease small subunit